jgi:hypothetical protein
LFVENSKAVAEELDLLVVSESGGHGIGATFLSAIDFVNARGQRYERYQAENA